MGKKVTILTLITFIAASCFGGEAVIHGSFTLNRTELTDIISSQSEAVQERILENPERFLELAGLMLNQPEEIYYLADKNHAVSRGQAPKETVRPADYGIPVTREEREVSSLIIDQLIKLVEAARSEGLEIVFASGYRPYDYQEMLYNRYVKQYGQEEADRFSAKPGTSQHQLGTAVDFWPISDDLALTPEGKWLAEHAGEYGFSLSYPQGMEDITGYMWESWHYRYITVEGIAMQREFFLGIQQFLLEFWHEKREALRSARR